MSLTHTPHPFSGTPNQVELEFDFVLLELTPRSALEAAVKYVEDTAVDYETNQGYGTGNVFTVDRNGMGIPNRGKR